MIGASEETIDAHTDEHRYLHSGPASPLWRTEKHRHRNEMPPSAVPTAISQPLASVSTVCLF